MGLKVSLKTQMALHKSLANHAFTCNSQAGFNYHCRMYYKVKKQRDIKLELLGWGLALALTATVGLIVYQLGAL